MFWGEFVNFLYPKKYDFIENFSFSLRLYCGANKPEE
jgi:hypothetical protein